MSLLKEPKGERAALLRALAQAAMSVTHHDADPDHEPGAAREVEAMERQFSRILRGKLRDPKAPRVSALSTKDMGLSRDLSQTADAACEPDGSALISGQVAP